jgi:hypothetical protein
MEPIDRLRHITASQHSLVTRTQARGVGLTRRALQHLVDTGTLVVVTPKLLRLGGAPVTPRQRALAAVLDAGTGGCLSHDSAAALYGLSGFRLDPLHVWRLRDRSDNPNRLAIQHVTRKLPSHHVLAFDGIPVTTPTRMLLDQAARLDLGWLARLVDETWAENLTNYYWIDTMLCHMSKQGRTGLTNLRTLADERGPAYRPPESNLERRVQFLLRRAGYEGFDRQVNVSDEAGFIGRIDMRHRLYPLALEVQSDRYHAFLTDARRDDARILRLRAVGLVVVEIREHDAWYQPQRVIDLVAQGIADARRLPRSLAS